jgi:transposase
MGLLFSRRTHFYFEMDLTKEEPKEKIVQWQTKIRWSILTCFGKLLTTLDNWLDKIAYYFAGRLNSSFVESLNNKIKITKRRC